MTMALNHHVGNCFGVFACAAGVHAPAMLLGKSVMVTAQG
jgi:hypothetical protein